MDHTTDAAHRLLSMAFGEIPGLIEGVPTALSTAIQYLNAGVLAIAAGVVGFTIIKGVVDTATQGEMLGKKVDAAWHPLRMATGSAALLPIAKGWTFAQLLVFWLVLQGSNLADELWSASSSAFISGQAITMPTQRVVAPLIAQVFQSSACAASLGDVVIHETVTKTVSTWSFDSPTFGANSCPGFTANRTVEKGFLDRAASQVDEWLFTGDEHRAEYQQQVTLSQVAALRQTIASVMPIATDYVKSLDNVTGDQLPAINESTLAKLQSISLAHANSLRSAAADAIKNQQNLDAVQKQIESDGWVAAGAAMYRLTDATRRMSSLLNDLPKPIPADYQDQVPDGSTNVETHVEAAKRLVRSMTGDTLLQVKVQAKDRNSGGLLDEILSRPMQKLTDFLTAQTDNPLVFSKNLGDGLIAATEVAAGITIAGGLDAGVATLGFGLVAALVGLAFMLSAYLPMLPIVIWVAFVIGWLVLMLEALVAAPVMALGLLHPEGHAVLGKSGAGWRIICSIALRPAAGVIALIAATSIVLAGGWLINQLFLPALTGANAGSVYGVVSMLFMIAIYVIILKKLIETSYGIINELPNKIMEWMSRGGAE